MSSDVNTYKSRCETAVLSFLKVEDRSSQVGEYFKRGSTLVDWLNSPVQVVSH